MPCVDNLDEEEKTLFMCSFRETFSWPVFSENAPALVVAREVFVCRHLKTIHVAFYRPQGVWVKGQSIYLVDAMLGQVLEFDRDAGSLLSTHGCFGASDGHLNVADGCFVRSADEAILCRGQP